jgi:hypothetical protein
MVGKILCKAKKNIISSHGRASATTQTLPILFTHQKACVVSSVPFEKVGEFENHVSRDDFFGL